MAVWIRRLWGAAVVGVALTGAGRAAYSAHYAQPSLPASRLSVWSGGAWREWWRSDRAQVRWGGPDSVLAGALWWRRVTSGLDWGEARLTGNGEAWRLRLIVARLDPRRVRLSLDTAFTRGRERPDWSIDRADSTVLLAVNAGQFPLALPWGWVVIGAEEFLPPGRGPLSTALVVNESGGVSWISGDSLARGRPTSGVASAFQSYPTLLATDGIIPRQLRGAGGGLDVAHRDARLAIGQSREGLVLVALTRFDGAGGALDFVPFGLTTPEMAAVMGALGARDAILLDGGISGQMLIRDPAGTRRWEGLRRVPLGLLVRGR